MKSIASAIWQGSLKEGSGTVTAESGAFNATPYNFGKRFEGQGTGTTPEELIAASHAGCFAMASSAELGKAGFTPTKLDVKCTVTLEFVDGKPTVTKSHLEMRAKVPGIDNARFQVVVGGAKAGCPISRLLNAQISLEAALEG